MDDIGIAAMDDWVVVDDLLRAEHLPDVSTLSEREREVLALALDGLSAQAIADRMSLTEATVRSHLSRIYSKLGVAGRVELLAQMNGGRPLNSLPRNFDALDKNAPPDRPPRPLRRLGIVLFVGLRPPWGWASPCFGLTCRPARTSAPWPASCLSVRSAASICGATRSSSAQRTGVSSGSIA